MLCPSAFVLGRKRWHSATKGSKDKASRVQLVLDITLGLSFVLWTCFTNSGAHFYAASWGWLAQHVSSIQGWVEHTVRWLMGWPAGLKLNENLDNAIGNTFLWVSNVHLKVSSQISAGAIKIPLVALLGVACFSSQVCVIGDFVRYVCFGNICLCSYAVRRLYRSFVQILVSLWRLFRGNKFNPLRNRVDTCIYTLDELFVGTLAFVIACYLVPSVAAYHYFFSVCMYCADIIEAVLWLVYACIFSFPIAPLFSWCFFPSKDEKEITTVNNSPVIIVNIFSYFTFRYYILLYCINV